MRNRGTWSGLAVLCPSVWQSHSMLTCGLGLMLGAGPSLPSCRSGLLKKAYAKKNWTEQDVPQDEGKATKEELALFADNHPRRFGEGRVRDSREDRSQAPGKFSRCLSHSLMSLSHSLSLSLSRCLSHSLSLAPSFIVSLSPSLVPSLSFSTSLSPSFPLSHTLALSLAPSLSYPLTVCLVLLPTRSVLLPTRSLSLSSPPPPALLLLSHTLGTLSRPLILSSASHSFSHKRIVSLTEHPSHSLSFVTRSLAHTRSLSHTHRLSLKYVIHYRPHSPLVNSFLTHV